MFFLWILASFCIGAGVSNSGTLTVKPATPKLVISKVCHNEEANNLIKKFLSKGYIFKSYTGAGASSYGILVMEKY